MPVVAPSMLAANFSDLKKDVAMLNGSRADWLHIDVMDGVFVPNISFGTPVIRHIKKLSRKPLDVHLMIVKPERYISLFREIGAEIITIHYEACKHLHSTIQKIKRSGAKAGVSINPHTSVSLLNDILGEIDLALVMSVNPGFGSQKFIPQTYKKLAEIKELAWKKNPDLIIEVDGGVTLDNAKKIIEAGANALVSGSSIFTHENPAWAISFLKSL